MITSSSLYLDSRYVSAFSQRTTKGWWTFYM